ncbi:hypothetical protein [Streptomyces sp. NPDC127072]|uniref:hypothetical protein n=1 Tax=Streptomyces sp. NPDC127072 TaxID=3347129 RepID=UPI0036575DCE
MCTASGFLAVAVGVAMLMVPVMSTVPGLRAVLSLRAVPGLWTVLSLRAVPGLWTVLSLRAVPGLWTVPVMAMLRVIRVGWVASVGLRV